MAAFVVQSTHCSLPADFPRDVAAFACDLDRTLIAEDAACGRARARRRARVRERGIRS